MKKGIGVFMLFSLALFLSRPAVYSQTKDRSEIPEKYTWTTSDYMGAVPAIGLGGAAYIIAVMDMINQ